MKINELPLGQRLYLGAMNLNGEETELVWTKVSSDNQFILNNALRGAFDEREPENVSRPRRSGGNNFYPWSNIHQYLNSSGTNWFIPAHSHDMCIRHFDQTCGFLSAFNESEFDAIMDTELTIATPVGSRKEHGAVVKVSAKVYLPSAHELDYSPESETKTEAARNEFLSQVVSRISSKMATRTGGGTASRIITYYGRTPVEELASSITEFHPMLRLNGETEVYADGNLFSMRQTEECTFNDFTLLLFNPKPFEEQRRKSDEVVWSELFASVKENSYAEKYRVGDTFPIDIGSARYRAQIIGFNFDKNANQHEIPLTMMLTEFLPEPMRFNALGPGERVDENGNFVPILGTGAFGGFMYSDICAHLNGSNVYGAIPDFIREHIIPASKVDSVVSNEPSSVRNNYTFRPITHSSNIWMPSHREVLGVFSERYPIFHANSSRRRGDTWMLRDSHSVAGNMINAIRPNGSLSYVFSDAIIRIPVCFCIG